VPSLKGAEIGDFVHPLPHRRELFTADSYKHEHLICGVSPLIQGNVRLW